ncbi:MAG: glycosyltransferase family 1 protein [Lactobacillus delbrueckii]|jgi:glycosyltransferase involved in cell wall biosynthesis|nr:glycosyltransferase family 1 protein [Lactobacillus delbrueckii]MCH4219011.1 glycosyltransferase family 1 protein [Lactobacillus delbrueckii]MCH4252440.1 glycosyltransferase family 1 protein [Lactobacillus delbrueckii]
MKQVKVLMVGMTSGVGGVETFMTNINRHIDHSKFKMDFLVHQQIAEKYVNDIENTEARIFTVPGVKEGVLTFLKELFSFYRKHDYDIVHLNECSADFFIYCLPLLFNRKTKLIVHSHNGSTSQKSIHAFLRLVQNKRANEKWSCSDEATKWMYKNDKDVTVIRNGIEVQKYLFSTKIRNRVRDKLGIENKVVIGSVARFEKQKNHKKIIDVFNVYHKQKKDSVLLLIGKGHLLKETQEYVKSLNLQDSVIFLGVRNDVDQLLMAMDVFIMPSLYEGLPFVAIEAQAASLPILISDTVSAEVYITDLVHTVELNAADDIWASQIDLVYKTENERATDAYQEQLDSAGYSIKAVCKQIEGLYAKLIAQE